jgi:hypothetical protein
MRDKKKEVKENKGWESWEMNVIFNILLLTCELAAEWLIAYYHGTLTGQLITTKQDS